MAFKLDNNGNIIENTVTGLSAQVEGQRSLEQDAVSECRCEQGGNFTDPTYGRSILVWKLSQTDVDKVADIKRIVTKYYNPNSISCENGIITVD
jgi:hypothetical protein